MQLGEIKLNPIGLDSVMRLDHTRSVDIGWDQMWLSLIGSDEIR